MQACSVVPVQYERISFPCSNCGRRLRGFPEAPFFGVFAEKLRSLVPVRWCSPLLCCRLFTGCMKNGGISGKLLPCVAIMHRKTRHIVEIKVGGTAGISKLVPSQRHRHRRARKSAYAVCRHNSLICAVAIDIHQNPALASLFLNMQGG